MHDEEKEWRTHDRPRHRRRGRRSDELTPEEKDEAARQRVRSVALTLLLGWLIVSVVNAIVLRIAVGYAVGPGPANPKDMWAWNELGEFLLWASAILVPICVLGVVSAVRMRRLRGYWLAVSSSMVLLVLSFPFGIVCPALWIAPGSALLTLSNHRVSRIFRLAREAGQFPPTRSDGFSNS
jgi:hypothetical protein